MIGWNRYAELLVTIWKRGSRITSSTGLPRASSVSATVIHTASCQGDIYRTGVRFVALLAEKWDRIRLKKERERLACSASYARLPSS